MIQVLYVGKGEGALEALRSRLECQGMQFFQVTSQRRALEELGARPPDLVIVDASGSRVTGHKLCRSIRRRSPNSMIMLIINQGASVDGIPNDAWLARPFTWRKLATQIDHALTKRDEHLLQVGPFRLNIRTREFNHAGETVRLSPKLAQLLGELLQHAGEVVTRRHLMQVVWHTSYLGDTRTLDVHIHWLREKIEPDPDAPIYLTTVRGIGYRFEVPEASD